MTVVVLSACPIGLRGQLTRWLLEISPGVFVGHVSARVRDLLWNRIIEFIGRGRALMVYSTKGEQQLAFRTHGHEWIPEEFDGIQLIRRPTANVRSSGENINTTSKPPPEGWSIAARSRRFGHKPPRSRS